MYVETIPSHGWFIEYDGIVLPPLLEKNSAQSLMLEDFQSLAVGSPSYHLKLSRLGVSMLFFPTSKNGDAPILGNPHS